MVKVRTFAIITAFNDGLLLAEEAYQWMVI